MITVSEKVQELVNQSPYLREALSSRLVNLSSLARELRPQVERDLMKPTSTSAVFMALSRYIHKIKPYYAVNPADYLANLGLRSDLFELTVKNSSTLLATLSTLAQKLQDEHATVFVFTQGMYETTIITSSILEKTIRQALKDEIITSTIPDLTGITLIRTHGQIETTGVLQYPLRILAWQGISVIEIVTTLNEMMIVVRDFEVDQAVVSIRQGLATSRKYAESPSKKSPRRA